MASLSAPGAHRFRDRTLEFLQLAASLQQPFPGVGAGSTAAGFSQAGQHHQRAPSASAASAATANSSSRAHQDDPDGSVQFNTSASAVRQAMALVAGNLDRLQADCGKQSLFSDLDRNISQQAQFIKKELDELGSHIGELEQHATLLARASANRHFAHSATKIVAHLKGELMQLTKQLQECLMSRQRNVKAQHQRRSQYESDQAPVLRKRNNIHTFSAIAALEEAEQAAAHSGSGHMVTGALAQEQMVALEEQQEQSQQRRQQNQLVASIETTIAELGTMYRTLIHHIATQGETAQRIDHNLGDAVFHVEEGKGQLLQLLTRTTQQRAFIIKCLALVALLAVFLIVFARRG